MLTKNAALTRSLNLAHVVTLRRLAGGNSAASKHSASSMSLASHGGLRREVSDDDVANFAKSVALPRHGPAKARRQRCTPIRLRSALLEVLPMSWHHSGGDVVCLRSYASTCMCLVISAGSAASGVGRHTSEAGSRGDAVSKAAGAARRCLRRRHGMAAASRRCSRRLRRT